jgi:peptidoglycan/LPS O-acetylase OafA/YrhL
VLWSLSVEEVFYLFFPLLCRFIKIRSLLVAIFLVVVGIGPFARTVLTHNSYWADNGYLSCMDSIALGCLTAILARSITLSNTYVWIARLTGAALMLLVVAAKPFAGSLGLYKMGLDATVLAFGTCLVILAISQTNSPGSKFTAPIRWYGRHSYEIYLTHMFLVFSFTRVFIALKLSLSWVLPIYFLTLLLSGFLGALIACYYSEPLNRKLRENLPRSLNPEMLPQQ